jgi:salicylate hydroxylase
MDCTRYDLYMDVDEKLAAKRGTEFKGNYVEGLPVGLELPSGVVGKE